MMSDLGSRKGKRTFIRDETAHGFTRNNSNNNNNGDKRTVRALDAYILYFYLLLRRKEINVRLRICYYYIIIYTPQRRDLFRGAGTRRPQTRTTTTMMIMYAFVYDVQTNSNILLRALVCDV